MVGEQPASRLAPIEPCARSISPRAERLKALKATSTGMTPNAGGFCPHLRIVAESALPTAPISLPSGSERTQASGVVAISEPLAAFLRHFETTPPISATRSRRCGDGREAAHRGADRLVVHPERARQGGGDGDVLAVVRADQPPLVEPRGGRVGAAHLDAPAVARQLAERRRPRGRRRSAPPRRRAAGARRCAACVAVGLHACRGGRGGRA